MGIISNLAGVIMILFVGYMLHICWNKIECALMPFLSVCIIVIFLMLCGMLDFLMQGRLLLYLAVTAGGIGTYFRERRKGSGGNRRLLMYLTNPGVILFIWGSLAFIFLYNIFDHFYLVWDEFSHWGPFYKNVFEHNQLHYFYENNLVHPAYPQGATVFYYFMSLLQDEFQETDTFISLAVMLHACASTLYVNITKKDKRTVILGFLIVPLFFGLFAYSGPYVSVYLDTLMGAVFGAALIVAVSVEKCSAQRCISVMLSVVMMTLVKEIAVVLILVVLAVYGLRLLDVKGDLLRRKIISFALPCITAGGGLAVWKFFLKSVGCDNDQFSNTNIAGFFEKIFSHDSELSSIWNAFKEACVSLPVFYNAYVSTITYEIVMLCAGVVLFVLIRKRNHGKGTALSVLLMPVFLLAYLFSLFYVYVCNMTLTEALSCASFQRYVSTFLIGPFMFYMAALINFRVFQGKIWRSVRSGMLCAAGILILSLFHRDFLTLSYTRENTGRAVLDRVTESFGVESGLIDENSRIWVITQREDASSDNAVYMFQLHYTLSPVYVALDLPWNLNEQSTITTVSGFKEAILEHQITHVLVWKSDDYLSQNYGSVFSDHLNAVEAAKMPVLYKVDENGEDFLTLVGEITM